MILLLHNRYRTHGWRGARGRRDRRTAPPPRPRGRDPRALERGRRPRQGGARPARRRARSRRRRPGRAPSGSGRRTRSQHPSDARLARARRRAGRRRPDAAPSPQLPAVLRDRDRLPGRRAVLPVPREQHVPGRPAALPGVAARGRRLRGGAAPPAAPAVRARRPVRGGQRVDRGASARLGAPGLVNRHVAQLHAKRRVRSGVARRGRGVRARRRAPDRGEGIRHRDRRRAGRGRPARDRRDGTGRGTAHEIWPRARTSASPACSSRTRWPSCARAPRSCSPPRAGRSRARTRCSRRSPPACRCWPPIAAACRSSWARTRCFRRPIRRPGRTRSPSCGATPTCGPSAEPRRSRGARERFGEDRFYDRLMQLYGVVSP